MKTVLTILLLIILLVLISIPVLAEVHWNQDDTTIQSAVAVFIAADWAQTRYIASTPSKFMETNPFLGPHPSVAEVDQYFAVCLIGNTMIAYFLPPKYRKWWQAMSLGMEMGYVNHNYNLGVSMKF